MLQHTFSGPTSQDFLMSLTPSFLANLANYSSTLSVLLNEDGGIIDDTIITKHSDDSFYVVTNAGRATEDKAHIEAKLQEWNAKNKGKEVKWETMDGWGLVALQGPKAAEVLQGMVDLDLSTIKFGQGAHVDIDGARCHIARGGYTGEDGFEVIPHRNFRTLADDRSRYHLSRLLRSPKRSPATRMSSLLVLALGTVSV